MGNPKISVCLITYNQENYIREALDGIVMQKCDFEIEVVVSDDMSKDKTLQIINEYAQRYPYFRVLKNEKNLGMHRNWEKAIMACTGEYVALLEGDDFWIDDRKLQKQVDILDKDRGIAFCFTNAEVKNEVDAVYHANYVELHEGYYSMKDLLVANYPPTCSVVFRNRLFDKFPQAYFRSPYADWILHTLNAKRGSIYYLAQKTCTYRYNTGGVYGKSNELLRLQRKVKVFNSICEILQDTEWYALAKSKKRDARYTLKKYFLDKKDYFSYLKAWFA